MRTCTTSILPLLALALLAGRPLAAEETDAGSRSLDGRRTVFLMIEKGRAVDRFDAAFSDGALASAWLAKRGFPNPLALTATQVGRTDTTLTWTLSTANAAGDSLSGAINLERVKKAAAKRARGGLNGTLSLVRTDGTVRTFTLQDAEAAAGQ